MQSRVSSFPRSLSPRYQAGSGNLGQTIRCWIPRLREDDLTRDPQNAHCMPLTAW